MVGMELSIRKTRAAELLTAAAAHRTFVEHRLGGDQTAEAQQQIGHQLAEMVEGWVTGEDALEVACWHMQPTDTCDLAPGERPRTAPHGKTPLDPKPETPRRSTHGKRPRTGTGVCYSDASRAGKDDSGALAGNQGREGRAAVQLGAIYDAASCQLQSLEQG